MSIEWQKSNTDGGWFIQHEGVSIIVHHEAFDVNIPGWFLTCDQLGFQAYELTFDNIDYAKKEAIIMVEGRAQVLAHIVAKISDALGGVGGE